MEEVKPVENTPPAGTENAGAAPVTPASAEVKEPVLDTRVIVDLLETSDKALAKVEGKIIEQKRTIKKLKEGP